jgi:hypothetical protein
MTNAKPMCADCKIAMVEGEVLYTPNGAAHYPVEWLEREPPQGPLESLKPSSKFRRKLVSFRCPECGLLKDYAS